MAKNAARETPAELRESIEIYRGLYKEQFVGNLEAARNFYKKYPDMVTCEKLPEPWETLVNDIVNECGTAITGEECLRPDFEEILLERAVNGN